MIKSCDSDRFIFIIRMILMVGMTMMTFIMMMRSISMVSVIFGGDVFDEVFGGSGEYDHGDGGDDAWRQQC